MPLVQSAVSSTHKEGFSLSEPFSSAALPEDHKIWLQELFPDVEIEGMQIFLKPLR